MNKVILIGRLTRDPDIRYSQGENASAIARYTLAVDRRFTRRDDPDAQTADFISCKAFGKAGEFAEKYLHKGTKIAVEGRIQTGSYVNRDGVKIYTTDVIVENHEFVESRSNNGGGGYSRSDRGPEVDYNRDRSGDREIPQAPGDGFMNIPDGIDEELPFA